MTHKKCDKEGVLELESSDKDKYKKYKTPFAIVI
jgi:hypothetical protein